MGIYEKMPDCVPRRARHRVRHQLAARSTASTRSRRSARCATARRRSSSAMGGNFASATPDTEVTEAALRSCELTVQVSTKLNRSHVVPGRAALILPTLGRTDRDEQAGGSSTSPSRTRCRWCTCPRGRLAPACQALRSEVAIICELARELFDGSHTVPWAAYAAQLRPGPRRHRARRPGLRGLQPTGSARRTASCCRTRRATRDPSRPPRAGPTSRSTSSPGCPTPPGRLVLQTVRSHDQFNTTIYGLDDRYRGVKGGRRVVLVNEADLSDARLRRRRRRGRRLRVRRHGRPRSAG